MFAVYAPPADQGIASPFNMMWMVPDPDVAPAIWQLECPNRFFWISVEGPVLLYGKVPGGCLQAAPRQPRSVPSLSPEVTYSFFAETFSTAGRSSRVHRGFAICGSAI